MSFRIFTNAVIASLFILTGSTNLSAHEGGHHDHDHSSASSASRTWTIATEDAHLQGSFVSATGGLVQIRRPDGWLRSVAIDRLVDADQAWIKNRLEEIKQLNQQHRLQLVAIHQARKAVSETKTQDKKAKDSSAPEIGKHFKPFEKSLQLRWDKDYFYVGSDRLPDHPMMVGITAWQQQVPLPQKYLGDNAWRIPLNPVPAKNPMSTKNDFLRGAIALAVNGVPIFNPLNNRGVDAFLFGELDEYGGHCGRADDYHYHIAPIHLQETTGKDNPIAYALDGYPIFGYQDQKAADYAALDKLGGHKDATGKYHYHAQKAYPYLNGGFYGEVTKRGGQVDPQPRANPVRDSLPGLRGAKVTGFEKTSLNSYKLVYTLENRKNEIRYSINSNNSVSFEFQSENGETKKETYTPRQNRGGQQGRGQQGRGQGGGGQQRRGPNRNEPQAAKSLFGPDAMKKPNASFVLSSSAVENGGKLPEEYTGDGGGSTLPLSWKGGPKGTQSYAVIMDHLAPGDEMKGYWTLWDIPSTVSSLSKNTKGIGKVGEGFRGQLGYEPPRSKGGGEKIYVFTVYALSSPLKITQPAVKVNRDVLLTAMKDKVLASSSLSVSYTRSNGMQNNGQRGEGQGGQRGGQRPPPRDDQAQGGQRKPWIQMHGAELDANRDGVITSSEFADDVNRAIALYDKNNDKVVSSAERQAAGDVRKGAAFAGLTYRHFTELDTNADGNVSHKEYHDATKTIFSTADQDSNGSVTKSEWESSPQAPLRKKRTGDRPPPREKRER